MPCSPNFSHFLWNNRYKLFCLTPLTPHTVKERQRNLLTFLYPITSVVVRPWNANAPYKGTYF
jgi:hypothetical protein